MTEKTNLENGENRLMTPDEAADYLGLKKGYLYRLTHLKMIPYLKYGRLVRFKAEDLKEWRDNRLREIPTRAQMQEQAAAYCLNNPKF